MELKNVEYSWNGPLTKRNSTKYIILHHRAGNGDAESIHNLHLSNGWTGIGYHFYVRKDGSIYRGRPVETVGAHCQGQNNHSVGVCFEGNFENEKTMSAAQVESGRTLVTYIKTLYPNAEVKRHKDFGGSTCPGRYFPFDEVAKEVEVPKLESANDIIWELMNGELTVEINDVDRAVKALDEAKNENSSLYWILYKIVNRKNL